MILPPSPRPFLASLPGHVGRVTLLGAPLDRTGAFRPGCAEGPAGVRWASDNLEDYSPALDRDLRDLDFGDMGDLSFDGLSQAAALDLIQRETGNLLDAGTLPIVLGGEHTIALGIARAVFTRHPDALVLHFDAHADLRPEYEGETLSHACWAHHVGQEFGFDRLLQLGVRSGTREEYALGRAQSGLFTETLLIPDILRAALSTRPVFLSLDLDVLDPSAFPGTGTPEAGGVTYAELMACLYSLADVRVVAIDVNEVAPPLDPTGVTAATAAKVVREVALLWGK